MHSYKIITIKTIEKQIFHVTVLLTMAQNNLATSRIVSEIDVAENLLNKQSPPGSPPWKNQEEIMFLQNGMALNTNSSYQLLGNIIFW